MEYSGVLCFPGRGILLIQTDYRASCEGKVFLMDFGPLHKILELEQSKGYKNTAVIGGLDRFLQNWSGPAMALISNRRFLSRFRKLGLDKPNYASMTPEQRQQKVKIVWPTDLEQPGSSVGYLTNPVSIIHYTRKRTRQLIARGFEDAKKQTL